MHSGDDFGPSRPICHVRSGVGSLGAMPRAQSPTHRPAWMVVLAVTMLMFGGQTLVEGLLKVRDPKALVRQVTQSQARTPHQEEALAKLEPIRDAIIDRHRLSLKVDAVASIALGLFVLYAASAVLSRDRNGRAMALLTAYLCIAYHLNGVVLWVRMAKETIQAAGPLLAEITAQAGNQAAGRNAPLAATVVARQPMLALVGIGWCLLLLLYFGGRNGRELYGLPQNPKRVPNLPR